MTKAEIIRTAFSDIAEMALDFNQTTLFALNKTVVIAESIGGKKEVVRFPNEIYIIVSFDDGSIFRVVKIEKEDGDYSFKILDPQ